MQFWHILVLATSATALVLPRHHAGQQASKTIPAFVRGSGGLTVLDNGNSNAAATSNGNFGNGNNHNGNNNNGNANNANANNANAAACNNNNVSPPYLIVCSAVPRTVTRFTDLATE